MKKLYIIIILLIFSTNTFASTGTIDDTDHTAKVCHDVTCTSPTPGSINWKPTGTTVVVDSVTGLSGQIWGNELGWIDLKPTTGGVTFSDVTTGKLTGKAWSQVSGWINFAPTGHEVTIDPGTGEFSGYAWSGGPYGGWIKFDCGDPSSCVKTSWRHEDSDPDTGGGGSIKKQDVCKNIPDTQSTIPTGYTIDSNGNCVLIYDACPNLAGTQPEVPTGYTKNNNDFCVPNSIDYCPNMPGIQQGIPEPRVLDQNGNCVIPPKDLCNNIVDNQESVPNGYYAQNGSCFLIEEGEEEEDPDKDEDPEIIKPNPDDPDGDGDGDKNPITDVLKDIKKDITSILGINNNTLKIDPKVLQMTSISTASILTIPPILNFVSFALKIPTQFIFNYFWHALLVFLGIKKRPKPWGTVYDSDTKRPLDPVYITLLDEKGEEKASSISDMDGRYGFVIEPGIYTINAGKTNYLFPSKRLAGSDSDILYDNLYFGEKIEVLEDRFLIKKNIPLDQLAFDWNEEEKKTRIKYNYFDRLDIFISILSKILFYAGFVFSLGMVIIDPSQINILIIILYVVIYIFGKNSHNLKVDGSVFSSTGKPMPFSILRFVSAATNTEIAHKVSDKMGRYYAIIPNGTYNVVIDEKKEDGTYLNHKLEGTITVTNGYINKKFVI